MDASGGDEERWCGGDEASSRSWLLGRPPSAAVSGDHTLRPLLDGGASGACGVARTRQLTSSSSNKEEVLELLLLELLLLSVRRLAPPPTTPALLNHSRSAASVCCASWTAAAPRESANRALVDRGLRLRLRLRLRLLLPRPPGWTRCHMPDDDVATASSSSCGSTTGRLGSVLARGARKAACCLADSLEAVQTPSQSPCQVPACHHRPVLSPLRPRHPALNTSSEKAAWFVTGAGGDNGIAKM
eukprot:COSAG01_NODE_1115_length_11643_cov_197.836798_3_plen_244_part_00